MWEARKDKSLIDYLDKELTSSYDDLQNLLFKLIKGGKDEGDEVDETKATEQACSSQGRGRREMEEREGGKTAKEQG